jgi:hypothetical protein
MTVLGRWISATPRVAQQGDDRVRETTAMNPPCLATAGRLNEPALLKAHKGPQQNEAALRLRGA